MDITSNFTAVINHIISLAPQAKACAQPDRWLPYHQVHEKSKSSHFQLLLHATAPRSERGIINTQKNFFASRWNSPRERKWWIEM